MLFECFESLETNAFWFCTAFAFCVERPLVEILFDKEYFGWGSAHRIFLLASFLGTCWERKWPVRVQSACLASWLSISCYWVSSLISRKKPSNLSREQPPQNRLEYFPESILWKNPQLEIRVEIEDMNEPVELLKALQSTTGFFPCHHMIYWQATPVPLMLLDSATVCRKSQRVSGNSGSLPVDLTYLPTRLGISSSWILERVVEESRHGVCRERSQRGFGEGRSGPAWWRAVRGPNSVYWLWGSWGSYWLTLRIRLWMLDSVRRNLRSRSFSSRCSRSSKWCLRKSV